MNFYCIEIGRKIGVCCNLDSLSLEKPPLITDQAPNHTGKDDISPGLSDEEKDDIAELENSNLKYRPFRDDMIKVSR